MFSKTLNVKKYTFIHIIDNVMTDPNVTTATESETEAVIDLKRVFAADPATRWVWPNPPS